ncbi:MAG: FtsW/RodA/SpoVE family cell cycle protein [Parcubacteria group bacterium]
MKALKIDIVFLISLVLLFLAGLLIFFSASLGLLSKQNFNYGDIVSKQLFLGGGLGLLALIITSKIDYRIWRKYAFYLFVGSILVNLLVFVPQLGFTHGGATRWLDLGPITFQPSEFLRLATVMYFATWLSSVKNKVNTIKYGFLPLCAVLAISEGIFLLQHDTDLVIVAALIGMFIAAGGKIKHLLILGLICGIGLAGLAFTRPYVMERVNTFLYPQKNALGSGYQIQQSLIAIGSGGFFGRGFGQSVQKFNYLPEPMGDSIFSVASEEFGFIGAVALLLLFLLFGMRGLKISSNSKDSFGTFLGVGIILIIIGQAFTNIGAMVGVLPLTGVPLPFVSQGGTSLIFVLASCGIVLNISKQQKLK